MQRINSFRKQLKTQRNFNQIFNKSKNPSQSLTPNRLLKNKRNNTQYEGTSKNKDQSKNIKIILNQQNNQRYTCTIHPEKQALFQTHIINTNTQNNKYCYECVIELVKSNIKVHKIDKKHTILQTLLNEQLIKLHEQFNKLITQITTKYQQIKQQIQYSFRVQQKLDDSCCSMNQFYQIPTINTEQFQRFIDNLQRQQNCNKYLIPYPKIQYRNVEFISQSISNNKQNIKVNKGITQYRKMFKKQKKNCQNYQKWNRSVQYTIG